MQTLPLQIFLIDDNPDDRALVARQLKREFPELNLVQAAEPADFEAALASPGFDLVITDYQIQWTTGLHVLQRVKARWPDCPVIMFTATGSEEIAVQAMKLGLEDYVLKSAHHFSRLTAAVQNALEKAERRRALQQAENRFRDLFFNAPVGMYRARIPGQIVEANPALGSLLGWDSLNNLIGVNLYETLVDPAGRAEWRARLEAGQPISGYEAQIVRQDGAKVWVRSSCRVVHGPDGAPQFYDGVVEDITARKQAEEALRHSEERHRLISEITSDYLYQTRLENGRPVCMEWVSESFNKLTGYEAQDLQAGTVQLVHPDDLPLFMAHVQALMGGEAVVFEARMVRKDGQERWVRNYSRGVWNEDRTKMTAIVGAVKDITEQKLAEQALQASQERLLEAQRIGRMGDWSLDLAASKIYWSAQVFDLYHRNPALGTPSLDELMTYYTPESAHLLEQAMEQAITQGISIPVELEVICPDGACCSHTGIIRPVASKDGRVTHLVGVVQDVTERREAYRHIEALAKFPDQNPNPVLRVSREGVLLFANAACQPLLQGLKLAQGGIVPDLWMTKIREALETRSTLMIEVTCSDRIYTFDLAPFPADDYVNLYGQDITDRRRAEKEAHRLATVVEQASETILITDLEGKIEYVNPYFEWLTGYTRQEVIGQNPRLLKSGRQSGAVYQQLWNTIKSGQHWFGTLYNRRKDGTIYPEEAAIFPIKNAEGEILNFAAVKRDITDRVQAEERLQLQIQRMAALRTIDLTITASLDMRVTLNVLVDQVQTQLGVDATQVLLLNPDNRQLEWGGGRGFRSPSTAQKWSVSPNTLAWQVVFTQRSLAYPNLAELNDGRITNRPSLEGEGFRAYFGVPLIAKGQVKGVLEIYHRSPLLPDLDWMNFLEALSGQAAIAIDNTTLYESLQRSSFDLSLAYDATLEGWSKALELRDQETQGHSQRVTELTLRLAASMGLRDADLINIRRGTLLHDIGKMAVPDSILQKPGPLDPEEWEIMRHHPVYALEMLAPISYLRSSLDIPYCHHEKWDGTGYPRRLSGSQIPLSARLFAIVDVYDALSSDRPYRPAWEPERVLAYLREQSGKHFDPAVVETFLHLLSSSA